MSTSWEQEAMQRAAKDVHGLQRPAGVGRPLEPAVRDLAESRFGHNFAHVRVHTDADAAASARGFGARAYTVGSDIVFGTGQYAPRTPVGLRLLAHELTHTIQQPSASRTTSPATVSQVADSAEREADEVGGALLTGRRLGVQVATPLRIARQPLDEEAPSRAVSEALPPPGHEAAEEAQLERERAADIAALRHERAEQATERLEHLRLRISMLGRLIGQRHTEALARPEAERQPLQTMIHQLERELVRALEQRSSLIEDRIAVLQTEQAVGEAGPEIDRLKVDLAEHREDLGRLAGVFAPEKGAAFEETYRAKVAGLHCMGAAYAGLATLRSPAESAEIQRQVEEKAERGLKRRKPVDLNQFITVMDAASADKVAGPKQRARWSRKRKTWTPTLESLVRPKVHPTVPGYWFFGLALAEAYHSVLIGVSTWEQPPRTLWCDQHGCTLVPGTLDDFAREQAEAFAVPYSDWDTYVWQVVPPAEASALTPPGEAK